jgi:hypothetical protein
MKVGKLPTFPGTANVRVCISRGSVYAGFWYFITRSVRAETAAMQGEIAQLKPATHRHKSCHSGSMNSKQPTKLAKKNTLS